MRAPCCRCTNKKDYATKEWVTEMQASIQITPEFRFINNGSDAMDISEEGVNERDEEVIRRINVVLDRLLVG